MDGPGTGNRGLRVGHRERDDVVEILREAAAQGRIDLEELDQRIGLALAARTFGDLDDLVADLTDRLPSRAGEPAPVVALVGPDRQLGPAPLRSPGSAGYARDDPLRFDGGVSSEKRDGVWTVPPFLVISQGVGSVKLNCLRAVPAAELIEVELIGGAGSVVIILPDGWAADLDRVNKGWGTKTVRVPPVPVPGRPLLLCHGSVGLGSVKVRPGRAGELRRAGLA